MSVSVLRHHTEWVMVSNNVQPGGNFVVLDLAPATWYLLKVVAHNNAGSTTAEYEFATLTESGGTYSPSFSTTDIFVIPNIISLRRIRRFFL
jgi:hypothetical protein